MWMSLGWENARAAVPLSAVWEVVAGETPMPLPGSRPDLEGVIVRREMTVPVFDPRRWKGFFQKAPERCGDFLVVLNVEDCMDAIRVQEVDIVPELDAAAGEAGPVSIAGLGGVFTDGVASAAGRDYGILSLNRLAGVMHRPGSRA